MNSKLARYLVLGGCAYMLLHLGLTLASDPNVAVPIMVALMVFGTVAAGHRKGPILAQFGGLALAVFTLPGLVAGGRDAAALAFDASYLVAAAIVGLAGWRLRKLQGLVVDTEEQG